MSLRGNKRADIHLRTTRGVAGGLSWALPTGVKKLTIRAADGENVASLLHLLRRRRNPVHIRTVHIQQAWRDARRSSKWHLHDVWSDL